MNDILYGAYKIVVWILFLTPSHQVTFVSWLTQFFNSLYTQKLPQAMYPISRLQLSKETSAANGIYAKRVNVRISDFLIVGSGTRKMWL